MKIALVHDWLVRLGGAERVLIAFHKIFPEAPIYTLFYDKEFVSQYLPKAKISASFLHKVPNIKKLHPWLKILMPFAIESIDLSDFDLIISSSHEFSHGILSKQSAKHICFYHSPSRILWDRTYEYAKDFKERGKGAFKLSLIKLGQHFLRIWDHGASRRPDIVLANSKHVAQRIKKYYGREAQVIYPPVEITASESAHRMAPAQLSFKNYFLIVSQLYPHKNLDLAIEAFKRIPDLNLVIIGDGPEYKNLKIKIQQRFPASHGNLRRAKSKLRNVELLGFVSDEDLPVYYKGCLAYLICNEEDFGISPLEAMSFGKPVLAYKKGGVQESVLEGKTGEFFDKLEPGSLSEAAELINEKIKSGHFNEMAIKKHSEKFSFERFKKEVFDIIKSLGYNLA